MKYTAWEDQTLKTVHGYSTPAFIMCTGKRELSYPRIGTQGSQFTNSLPIGINALPLSFYVYCYCYQKKETATCWEESNIISWPMENVLFYFAHQCIKKQV